MTHLIKVLGLFVCLIVPTLSLAQSPADAPAASSVVTPGQLLVRLENGTDGSTARLEDIEIRAFSFEGTEQVFEETGLTGPGGVIVFPDVPLAQGRRVVVSALFQGVIYVAHGEGGTTPGDGASSLEVTVPVFESTGSLKNVTLNHFHMVIAPAKGKEGYSVSEILLAQNTGQTSVIGGDSTTVTLGLDAPDGLQDFSILEGVLSRHVSLGDGTIAYTGPLQPGETRMVFNYRIPSSSNWFYRRRFPVKAEQVSVFTPKTGPQILSSQLSVSEEVEIEGTTYVRYAMTEQALRSGGLKFEVSGAGGEASAQISSGESSKAVLIGAGIFGLIIMGMILSPLFQAAPENLVGPGEFVTRAEARRLALTRQKEKRLNAVREIDFDYEIGKLSDEDYGTLRARYKAEAIEVLAELEALKAEQAEEAKEAEEAEQGEAAKGKNEVPEATPSDAVAAAVAQGPQALQTPQAPAVAQAFCHSCGAKVVAGDRFCSSCGTALRIPPTSDAPAPPNG